MAQEIASYFIYFCSMSLLASESSFYATSKSLGALYLFILFGLFLDSFYILEITEHAQFYANISMFIGFIITFWKVNTERLMGPVLPTTTSVGRGIFVFNIKALAAGIKSAS